MPAAKTRTTLHRHYTSTPNLDRQIKALMALLNASGGVALTGKGVDEEILVGSEKDGMQKFQKGD